MSRAEEIVELAAADFDGLADLRELVDPISLAMVGAWAAFRELPREVCLYAEDTPAWSLWQIGFLLAQEILEGEEEGSS